MQMQRICGRHLSNHTVVSSQLQQQHSIDKVLTDNCKQLSHLVDFHYLNMSRKACSKHVSAAEGQVMHNPGLEIFNG